MSEFPRRNRLDLMTPAELAIRTAVLAVEELPADPLLTDAVVLLQQAREKVADFIDRSGRLVNERAELERHQAEAAKAIRDLEHRLKSTLFILDGLPNAYPGIGLERSTVRLRAIELIVQTLAAHAAAIQRAREQEGK